jgi:hypothetical protein
MDGWLKILSVIVAFICLGVSFWSGYEQKHGLMGVSFLSFIFLLAFSSLDRFSEIKASLSGFEAKTRKILEEAEITIKELQKLAVIVASSTLSLVVRSGRVIGFYEEEKEQIRLSTMRVLEELKVPKSEQELVLKDWHRFTEIDYVNAILNRSKKGKDRELGAGYQKELGLDFSEHIPTMPTPDVLEDFLKRHNLFEEELRPYLEDYRYYVKYKQHRRPDVWAERRKWGKYI